MNQNSIVEFNTGKVKGLFISVPYNTIIEECYFLNKEGSALAVGYDFKNKIGRWIPIVIPKGNYKIVGLSHQITEKQINDELRLTYLEYLRFLGEKDITVNYSDFSNYWMVVVLN